MVSVLQNQNILLMFSKHFLFFEWKLEESDLRACNILRSPEFNLGGEDKKSFLEINVRDDGVVHFNLHNPKHSACGYYVLTILDKHNSLIKSITNSAESFLTSDKVDLFGEYSRLPSTTGYPIRITCTAKSSANNHFPTSSVNYEKRMNEITSDLKNVLDQGLNTDIELITDGESIKAHQIVLQARSPVFRKMFEHDSIEASNNTVAISDIGSATVKKLVNFLYTGTMDKCDFDEAMDLYYAADKYEVLSLREDCRVELLNHLDVNNACRLFTLSNSHDDYALKEKVVQFVSANLMHLVSSGSMNEMSKEDILLLMSLAIPAMVKQ